MEVTAEIGDRFIIWTEGLIGGKAAVFKEPYGEEGLVYRLDASGGSYFLKIKTGSTFLKEQERLEWLGDRLPVPKVLGRTEENGTGAILLTAIEGKNLALLCKEWPVEKVIDKLADALHQFHAVDTTGWPFDKPGTGKVLVHGDACLPNFIFKGDAFSGYIDLRDAALANVEIDLAAAVWSLQFNLGPGYGPKFLEKYGYRDATKEMAEKLRLEYEDYQEAQGFL
jgi:kanamycin kinase